MSDELHRTPAASLERPGRLRPSWLRRLARLAVRRLLWLVICLCVAIITGQSDLGLVGRGHTCAAAYRRKLPETAEVCEREYQRTQDPTTGVHLADALSKTGNKADRAAARQVATELLDTPARSDALYILGKIARDEDNNDDALTALNEAQALHRLEQRPYQLARDDGVLAMVHTDRSEFAEALRLIDECIMQARLADDTDLQCYCHLAAAKALIRVGYWGAVERELETAKSLVACEKRRSDLEYQYASFEQDSRNHARAITGFKKALQYGKDSQSTPWVITTESNLAYSLAENGNLQEALQYLDHATHLDSDHQKERARTWAAAQIAYRQHDLGGAATLTEKFFKLLGPDDSAAPDDRDDRIDAAVLGARVELERSDLKRAEFWAEQGVEEAEHVREQSVLELRPWVLEKRRAPYELLFTALARSQQIEEAAMAFDAWQGRTVQDALATPRPPASLSFRGIADQVTRLDAWLQVASPALFAPNHDKAAVLHTMQGIDLLALIVADGDVWSLVANHGPPRLSKIKPLAEILNLVEDFRGHPTDLKLASDLGALLLPDDAFRKTHEVLHVLVDGQLGQSGEGGGFGGLPVAALRHGGTPLIAMRPIVRLLRLPETRCVHVIRTGHATVIGAPGPRIPDALAEAEQVAGLLRTTSKIGPAATKEALFAAKNDSVLHIAAHGTMGMDGASLELVDGEVPALAIWAHRVAPSLAVLSACDAVTANDSELAGSLAAGFLGAGSQHVVATLRSISDSGALEISTRFYGEGGVADPARALAIVQSALANTSNTDWPNVAVFGPDVCTEDIPGHP
jgi:tetratricopeptide (TPR) repeat protein